MNILLANFCVSSLVSFFAINSKVASRYATLFMFICIFIIHAFADINSLEDLYYYSLGFDEIKRMSVWQCITTDVEICKMERGFAILLKLFSILGLGFRAFLIANSLFITILFYKSIVRYSPYVLLSSLLFLLIINNQSIYVVRQYLVVAVFFYSIRWILDRNLWKYLLACVACFFIHQSSLILIPIYFLYKLDTKKLLLSTVLAAFLLKAFLEIILNYFGSALVGYMSYISYDDISGQNPVSFYISIVYLFIYVFFLRKNIIKDGINKLILICIVLNSILLFWFYGKACHLFWCVEYIFSTVSYSIYKIEISKNPDSY